MILFWLNTKKEHIGEIVREDKRPTSFDRIEFLADMGFLTSDEQDRAHTVRKTGNEGSHYNSDEPDEKPLSYREANYAGICINKLLDSSGLEVMYQTFSDGFVKKANEAMHTSLVGYYSNTSTIEYYIAKIERREQTGRLTDNDRDFLVKNRAILEQCKTVVDTSLYWLKDNGCLKAFDMVSAEARPSACNVICHELDSNIERLHKAFNDLCHIEDELRDKLRFISENELCVDMRNEVWEAKKEVSQKRIGYRDAKKKLCEDLCHYYNDVGRLNKMKDKRAPHYFRQMLEPAHKMGLIKKPPATQADKGDTTTKTSGAQEAANKPKASRYDSKQTAKTHHQDINVKRTRATPSTQVDSSPLDDGLIEMASPNVYGAMLLIASLIWSIALVTFIGAATAQPIVDVNNIDTPRLVLPGLFRAVITYYKEIAAIFLGVAMASCTIRVTTRDADCNLKHCRWMVRAFSTLITILAFFDAGFISNLNPESALGWYATEHMIEVFIFAPVVLLFCSTLLDKHPMIDMTIFSLLPVLTYSPTILPFLVCLGIILILWSYDEYKQSSQLREQY